MTESSKTNKKALWVLTILAIAVATYFGLQHSKKSLTPSAANQTHALEQRELSANTSTAPITTHMISKEGEDTQLPTSQH